jgi:hypothetical protein
MTKGQRKLQRFEQALQRLLDKHGITQSYLVYRQGKQQRLVSATFAAEGRDDQQFQRLAFLMDLSLRGYLPDVYGQVPSITDESGSSPADSVITPCSEGG